MNDRYFDLGNLAVNNELGAEAEEHLRRGLLRRASTAATSRACG